MYLNSIKLTFTTGQEADSVSGHFFIRKLMEQNEGTFDWINPQREVIGKAKEYLNEREAEVKNMLTSFGPVLSENTWDALSPDRPLDIIADVFFTTEPVIIFNGPGVDDKVVMFFHSASSARGYENHIRIVAKSQEDCEEFVGFFNSEINRIGDIVNNFVKLESLDSGEDLVIEDLKDNSEIVSWDLGDSENNFEEKIQSEVKELVGPCLNNVEVQFDSGNGEYDLIAMPTGRFGEKFAIEVKNFDRVQEIVNEEERQSELSAGNLQSKLINQPKINAERIGLNLIMIVNDIPDETYINLLRQANPLDVTFLNGENYTEGLEEQLINEPLKTISQ